MDWFKKHKVMTVVLVIIVIAIASSAAGGDNKNTGNNNNQSTSNSSSDNEPKLAKMNETARDGKFEFIVKSVDCGKTSVGANQYATKEAQGQFCLMTVSVKNVGDEAQGLFSSNQKLLNAQGQQFAADDLASTYISSNNSTVFSNINPGNSVEGVIVFDIPKDQTPTVAELHDSAFSGGVKISLE